MKKLACLTLAAAPTLITVVGAVLLIRVAPQIFDRQYVKA